MTEINVARLTAVDEPFTVGTASRPRPGSRDVLVRVEACGVVPNAYNVVHGKTPFVLPALPSIFGLDVSGVIEEVGEQVIGLSVGQRVYVDPHLVCGTCVECRRDRPDLCRFGCLRGYFAHSEEGAELMNQYPFGGLSEYVVAPDQSVAALPDTIDFYTAARFGYLGTSFGALRKGRVGPGQTLLINGVTGTLGVAAVMIALAFGVTKIFGVVRDPGLMKRVCELCPGRVETCSSEEGVDLADWVRKSTRGLGVDVLYDCLGVGGDGNTTNALIEAVRPGGRAVLVAGSVDADIVQSYPQILAGDIAVLGSNWFTSGEIDDMIALIDSGVLDLTALEHRPFALPDVNEAFDVVGSRPGGFTNVVVIPR